MFVERADGAYVWDLDGTRYLDCVMGNGSVILGHNHPAVQEAVRRATASGVTTGFETPLAVEAARLLARAIPDCGLIRFANTGTEAVLHALMIARAATGRERIAKAEGAYHGWADPMYVSCWPSPDVSGPSAAPRSVPESAGQSVHATETVVFPFNDPAATEAILHEHAHELAAVFVEPVMIDIGFVPATNEFLDMLRRQTARLGIILVFDELLTGFRVARGGARELYGIEPDLTIFGKAIANGYPLAAVEGKPHLLRLTDPHAGGRVSYVGTFNAHNISMAAATASLAALADGSIHQRLTALTEQLATGLSELSRRYRVPLRLGAGGGHFQPYFCTDEVTDYRSASKTLSADYAIFREELGRQSIVVASGALSHNALSAAHLATDVNAILAAADKAFNTMAMENQETVA
jgi:glutamate-1-semialdehyde 2,1-aminomutase